MNGAVGLKPPADALRDRQGADPSEGAEAPTTASEFVATHFFAPGAASGDMRDHT